MSGYLGDTMKSMLGQGLPGGQPKGGLIGNDAGLSMRGGSVRGRDRTILRKAFGNSRLDLTNLPNNYSPLAYSTHFGSRSGSFRAAMNAGDVLGNFNTSANKKFGPISNQVNGVKLGSLGSWGFLAGAVDKNGPAAYVGNPSYVYDSSDFTRYRKLKAKNSNYNDSSFGGSTKQDAYTARARARR